MCQRSAPAAVVAGWTSSRHIGSRRCCGHKRRPASARRERRRSASLPRSGRCLEDSRRDPTAIALSATPRAPECPPLRSSFTFSGQRLHHLAAGDRSLGSELSLCRSRGGSSIANDPGAMRRRDRRAAARCPGLAAATPPGLRHEPRPRAGRDRGSKFSCSLAESTSVGGSTEGGQLHRLGVLRTRRSQPPLRRFPPCRGTADNKLHSQAGGSNPETALIGEIRGRRGSRRARARGLGTLGYN